MNYGRDAVLFSVGANSAHGLRRTNEDKERSVKTLLNDGEWGQWPNREIARRCGVDEKMVRYMKAASAEIPQIKQVTVQRNGTTYTMNTANIGQRSAVVTLEPEQETSSSPAETYHFEQTYTVLPTDLMPEEEIENDEDEDEEISLPESQDVLLINRLVSAISNEVLSWEEIGVRLTDSQHTLVVKAIANLAMSFIRG